MESHCRGTSISTPSMEISASFKSCTVFHSSYRMFVIVDVKNLKIAPHQYSICDLSGAHAIIAVQRSEEVLMSSVL